jgi:asparagine synthase (glutamine-hydrolysing)
VQRVPLLYGQPFGDSSAIPTYFVAQAAARHRKVVLNGDGGDEVFAGYRRYWTARAAPWLAPLAAPVRPLVRAAGRILAQGADRRSGRGFAARALRGLGASARDRGFAWSVDLLDDQELARCFPELARRGGIADRLEAGRGSAYSCHGLLASQQSDHRLILADDLVAKMDIATMAHSLEARSPLLDIPLTELAWSLPPRWLITWRETKPLLRTLARRRLPAGVAGAPKRGFEVPVARWLAHELRPLVADCLLGRDGKVAQLGDREAIRRLIEGGDRFSGNRAQTVWCLLVLELFLRAPTPSRAAS